MLVNNSNHEIKYKCAISFYIMLLKYKKRNPNFNINRVLNKLYSKQDINYIKSVVGY